MAVKNSKCIHTVHAANIGVAKLVASINNKALNQYNILLIETISNNIIITRDLAIPSLLSAPGSRIGQDYVCEPRLHRH